MAKRYARSGDSKGDAGGSRVPLTGGFCRRVAVACLLFPRAGSHNRFVPLSWALEVERDEESEVVCDEECWSLSDSVEELLAPRPALVKLGCFINSTWYPSP
jgi:hypothetical protein